MQSQVIELKKHYKNIKKLSIYIRFCHASN